MPNEVQRISFKIIRIYVQEDKSLVLLLFTPLIICGRNNALPRKLPIIPNTDASSIEYTPR
jgi:hypothetical protein